MENKTDASYGIIPLRFRNSQWEVLLINQYSKIGNNTYWVFPKGHPEEGESPVETAVRELKEETGLMAESVLLEPQFNLSYSFTFDGRRINKKVVFWLSVFKGDPELKLDPEEVREAGWFSLDAAIDRVDYKDTKQMLQKVIDFLGTKKEGDLA